MATSNIYFCIRVTKWTPETRATFEGLLWMDLKAHPSSAAYERAAALTSFMDMKITTQDVAQTLQSWNMGRKVPKKCHFNKVSCKLVFKL